MISKFKQNSNKILLLFLRLQQKLIEFFFRKHFFISIRMKNRFHSKNAIFLKKYNIFFRSNKLKVSFWEPFTFNFLGSLSLFLLFLSLGFERKPLESISFHSFGFEFNIILCFHSVFFGFSAIVCNNKWEIK